MTDVRSALLELIHDGSGVREFALRAAKSCLARWRSTAWR